MSDRSTTARRSSISTFGVLHGRMGGHMARMVPLYDESNAGGASSGGGGNAAPTGGNAQPANTQTDLQAVVATYQQQIRDLERRIPGEGAVVLDATQATLWQRYQQMGAPEAIEEERTGLRTEVTGLRVSRAAAIAGLKESGVRRLGGDILGNISIRMVDQNGTQAEQAFVKVGDQEMTLADYAAQQWPEFLSSLKVEQPQTGTQFPRQTAGGSAAKPDLVAESLQSFQAARDARPNPFAPKK
jgi:hypothetical protein